MICDRIQVLIVLQCRSRALVCVCVFRACFGRACVVGAWSCAPVFRPAVFRIEYVWRAFLSAIAIAIAIASALAISTAHANESVNANAHAIAS